MQSEEKFTGYIFAFKKKLELVIIDDITSTLYVKRYLAYLLDHKDYYLEIYADVLHKLIRHSDKKKSDILLLDYGSGNGLLGIFAKFCGFQKVFLNDIDANFVSASEKLSAQTGIEIDGFIAGDVAEVRAYFKNEIPGAIVGTDVIEHIYDLGSFLKSLQDINQSMVSVFTTASNPSNYFKVSKLKKMQLKDEFIGGAAGDNIFFGDSPLEPFLQIRKRIIMECKPDLPVDAITELATATRGLNRQDIIFAVEQYSVSGKMPGPPPGANTCDPLSGCWTERILTLKEYISLYGSAGFKPVFYNGFYNKYEHGLKHYAKKILNAGLPILGKWIAPYIIIVGRYI
ncbi:MAG: hypothetical protein ABIQ31_07160 [Ferruginibacter sp.]